MRIFEADINPLAIKRIHSFQKEGFSLCNQKLQELTGIIDFFETEADFEAFNQATTAILTDISDNALAERAEFGDFQTPISLAQKVCEILRGEAIQPKIVIEPTFGKGNFILAALKTFDSIETITGVEIYKPYVWQTKFSILEYYLNHNKDYKPLIRLLHQSVFDFDFKQLEIQDELLVLGNPPWVTNAMLSTLDSDNLPRKSNFKNHSGLDALTGKGNFDIGEYISVMLIKAFHQCKGNIALLVKNSVIKNILQDQKRNQYKIAKAQKQTIDAQKEFNASVDAALFLVQFATDNDDICIEKDFYTQKEVRTLGWVNGKFVANTQKYALNADLDGTCPFEWRQGIKHDCSKVMELEPYNGHFKNGKGEEVILEQDLVYGLLKSSDLKHPIIEDTRKNTIITQKKIGQDTHYIKTYYPQTWQYLTDNKSQFDNRKSSIYRGKPPFSIFGIGDYSFAPYKVAISGMYKTSIFSLVLPRDNKPIMLDDTCYFIGFDNIQEAMITQVLLNSENVQNFLQSIIFWDSKRAITKDILCRIDLINAIKNVDYPYLYSKNNKIVYENWEKYKRQFERSPQLSIF